MESSKKNTGKSDYEHIEKLVKESGSDDLAKEINKRSKTKEVLKNG